MEYKKWRCVGFNRSDEKNINNIIKIIKEECPDVLVIQEYQTEYREQLVKNGLEKIGYKFFAVCKDCPGCPKCTRKTG